MSVLIKVKDHDGRMLQDVHEETDDYKIVIPQDILEEANSSRVGRFLLDLLGAVDSAGNGLDTQGRRTKRRPILLLGWKHRQGTQVGDKMAWRYVDGFTLHVSVPSRVKTSSPRLYGANGGVV